MLHFINLENQNVFLDLALWQRILERIVPDMIPNEPRIVHFSQFLHQIYQTHNVSEPLLRQIHTNLNLYLTVLQSLEGKDVNFKDVENKEITGSFEDEVLEMHQTALHLLKNIKFLNYFTKPGGIGSNATEDEQKDTAAEIFQVVTQQINYVLDLSVHLNPGNK